MFEEIKGKLGFGAMRLALDEKGEIDLEHLKKAVDYFISSGFNYFDTAHGYLDGRSEEALKFALTTRYKRSDYIIADKLSSGFFERQGDIRPFFFSQLENVGVDYFDNYLMHALSKNNYDKYISTNAFDEAFKLKKEGYIRHVGFSFHDEADMLERILKENPEVEFVQLQINYLDYDSTKVQGRRCLEICRKYGKPVIVMEPVKGGRLAVLRPGLKEMLADTPASYALRFAAGLDGVALVLSGMTEMKEVEENSRIFSSLKKLDKNEMEILDRIRKDLEELGEIACTSCRYCTEVCPKNIAIPEIFSAINEKSCSGELRIPYEQMIGEGGHASECIRCGRCEKACPQHIGIRRYLAEGRMKFES